MEVDLHGLFEHNSSFDYNDYEYPVEGHQSCRFCGFIAVFIPLLYSVGLLLGLLGNGPLLVILWRKRRNFSVMDIFILHLGVADVLLMLTLPLWAVDAVKGWILGTGLCKLTGALFKINLYFGFFVLALISLQSYLSIVRGEQMFSRKNPTVIHLSCVILWVISLLLSTPDWIYLKTIIITDETDLLIQRCDHVYPSNDVRINIRLLLIVVGVILPALVLLFCCSCILQYIWNRSSGPKKRKNIGTCVFAALVLVFFVGWTPYNITFIVDTVTITASKLCKGKQWTTSDATAVVSLLHCVIRPVIYFCLTKEFRQQALTVVKFRGCEADISDVSLWDCGDGSDRACVQQEEQSSLHPMNDIKQTTKAQEQVI